MNHKGVCIGLTCVFLSACGSDHGKAPAHDAGAFEAAAGAFEAGAGAAGDAEAGASNGDSGVTGSDQGVTVTVDSGGGELDLDGVAVTVPAGALSASTDLTLRRVGSSVPGYHLYSDVYELSPRGTAFAELVQIALPYIGHQALANAFATSTADPGFAWVGTTVTETTATAAIDSAGQFFVADGTDYVEAPKADCTRVDVIDGVFAASRALSLLVSATDCQGRPLAPQSAADFTALEDGEPLGNSAVSFRDPAPVAPFVTVLVDMNALAAAATETEAAISAALASITNPALRVGLSLYGGPDTLTELLPPTLDMKAVAAAAKTLARYKLPSKLAAASFAAAGAAVTELDTLRAAFKDRNAGGALANGFVIWVTAADSKEAKTAQATAMSTISDSGDKIITVSLGNSSALSLGNDEWFAAVDQTGLGRALAAAVQRVNALVGSTYWLGYCSQETEGVHGVGARVASSVFALGRTGVFDATSSLPGCDEKSPLSDCADRECGGAGCGACDDTTSACATSTGKCISYCDSLGWCGNASHDNPNGYAQTCADAPTRAQCDQACANLQTDSQNCGKCGAVCPAQTSCTDGACVCNAGYELCDGACVDTTLNSKNCGKCGTACGAGEGCFSGKCSSDCPTSLHGPNLVKIPTPSGGIMCIDATEVSEGQYKEFVQDRAGDASGQIPECSWNLYFEPPEGCTVYLYDEGNPDKHPQQCVDWCDAEAFCEWSGKRLCGGIDQLEVPKTALTDPAQDAWYNACSSGGTLSYPFGDTCQTFPCRIYASSVEVGSDQACNTTGAYAGIYDLSGNVQEWEYSCTPYQDFGSRFDGCQVRGGGWGINSQADCLSIDRLGNARCDYVFPPATTVGRSDASDDVGFRCCAR
jgi:formylglycine-generating enzyme